MRIVAVIFVFLALAGGLGVLLSFPNDISEVGFIGMSCLAAIIARIAQAEAHRDEFRQEIRNQKRF